MSRKLSRVRAPRRAAIATAIALAGAVALAGCAPSTTDSAADEILRVGVLGGGTSETLDPTQMDSEVSIARGDQIFEPLVRLGTGDDLVEYVLAESLTPNADASVWTLKLRDGVTWHDGTPLTVDDIVYTINYNVDNVTWGANVWSNVDRAGLNKVDDLTLEIPLLAPNFLYPESLVDINEMVIKDGTTSFEEPIGTGPFMFESFTPGQESKFVRNEDYWDGAPQLAAVEIHSIDDDTARVNALMSGQVDAIANVPFTGIAQLEAAGLSVSNEPSGTWVAIGMNTQLAPFDDPRVREAMTLLIDREQIVSNAYGGNAKVGNDLFGWFDPIYASLPQRTYDPERAKQLLAEAGYENLTLTLPTTGVAPGVNEMVTLFAASAAEAGVTITVQQQEFGEYYSTPPAERQWGPTYWLASPISSQINNQMSQQAIDAGTSETLWDDPSFLDAYRTALTTSDPEARAAQLVDVQAQMFAGSPYIIPAFYNIVTASVEGVEGLKTNLRAPFADYDFSEVTVARG